MRRLLRNRHGASTVEFALVSLPVVLFISGLIQTSWLVWTDNLLNIAVDTAARCGAVKSTTAPCMGSDTVSAANQVFGPLTGATFTADSSACSSGGGVGILGTYDVTFLFVVNLTLTAKSCYPTIS
jgi:Flp pilus assembly protein TadG